MTIYNDQISSYINDLFVDEDDHLRHVREESVRLGLPPISIKPEEGRFLQFLVMACGARRAIEVGVLGGYSGIWIARALPPGGMLFSLEKESDRAQIARQHFNLAGVADRVEVQVGDAHALLENLKPAGPFDFMFIDAEKEGYSDYFEWAIENLRPGGVIAAHNAFRKGSVAGQVPDDEFSEIMRRFNKRVAADRRVLSTIFPAGDGTVLAVKRG
jgi:predicted O-methyltransferase YrrM